MRNTGSRTFRVEVHGIKNWQSGNLAASLRQCVADVFEACAEILASMTGDENQAGVGAQPRISRIEGAPQCGVRLEPGTHHSAGRRSRYCPMTKMRSAGTPSASKVSGLDVASARSAGRRPVVSLAIPFLRPRRGEGHPCGSPPRHARPSRACKRGIAAASVVVVFACTNTRAAWNSSRPGQRPVNVAAAMSASCWPGP